MVNIIGFSEWLQKELDRRDWRPADLVRHGGIASSQLSRILNRERGVGPEVCVAIARALGIPPETVFREAGLLPPDADSDTPAKRELLHLFEQLPEDGKGMLLTIARAVVCEHAPKYQEDTAESE